MNLFVPSLCGSNMKNVISERMLLIIFMSTSCLKLVFSECDWKLSWFFNTDSGNGLVPTSNKPTGKYVAMLCYNMSHVPIIDVHIYHSHVHGLSVGTGLIGLISRRKNTECRSLTDWYIRRHSIFIHNLFYLANICWFFKSFFVSATVEGRIHNNYGRGRY